MISMESTRKLGGAGLKAVLELLPVGYMLAKQRRSWQVRRFTADVRKDILVGYGRAESAGGAIEKAMACDLGLGRVWRLQGGHEVGLEELLGPLLQLLPPGYMVVKRGGDWQVRRWDVDLWGNVQIWYRPAAELVRSLELSRSADYRRGVDWRELERRRDNLSLEGGGILMRH